MPVLLTALLLSATGDEAALRLAVDLYRGGEFEKALVALDAVAAKTADNAIRGRAHLTRGQCFAALQQFDRIEAAFTAALKADPEVSLDPTRVQPAIVSLLDAARERLRGELEVTGDAEVLLDDQPLGKAPLRQPCAIGRHRLEWRGSGSGRREIVVRANETTRVDVAPVVVPAAVVEAPAPAVVEERPPSELTALVELRATADPRDYGGAVKVAPAPELSVGLGGTHWSATAGAMVGAAFGFTVRVTGRLPRLLGPLGLEAAAHGTLLFSSPAVGGAALLVGPNVGFTSWLEAFVGAGGGFLVGSSAVRVDYVLLTIALRVRIRPG